MGSAPAVINRLPEEPGIYRFREAGGRTLYVGRAIRLRRRVRSYWGDLSDRRHLRRMVARVVRIEAVVCASAHEASWLERNLLEESRPRWNRAVGGAEVPLMITVDAEPPRLRLLHETGIPPTEKLIFGPFLGGAKVRLLASAVHRVYPIIYARDQLSAVERDLARIRGVTAADRQHMINAVTAVLTRDPDAVADFLAVLQDRRDAASASQSYETAGRIQSEIEAASWLLAPQRVATGPSGSTSEPVDLCGWHDGILVRFCWRAGRIRTWEIRRMGERSGRQHAEATPATWRDFTERNARLAANLRS